MIKKDLWTKGLGLAVACSLLLGGCVKTTSLEKEVGRNNLVTAFIQQANTSSCIWKGWGAQRLQEDTGLSLELASSGTQAEDKLKLYMSSGTIPDIIGFKNLNQAKLYMDAGLLLSLDEKKDLLPAIFQDPNYAQAIAYSREQLSNDSDNLLLMPVSIGTVAEDDYKSMPMLQWTAFKRCGLPQIDTMEDYLDVVEEMLKEKPLSNAGEVMYGFSLYQDDEGISVHTSALAYLYGLDLYSVSPFMETDMNDGSISSILEEGSFFKRALHFYFAANQKGLLDADSRNQTYSNLERKVSSGRVMLTLNRQMAEDYNEKQAGWGNSNRMLDGYAPLPAKDMKIFQESERVVGQNAYFAIHKNSSRVEDACKLLNWLYEEDTQFYLYNGPEGIIWEYDTSGQPRVTEEGEAVLTNHFSQLGDNLGTLAEGTAPFGELGRTRASLTTGGYALHHKYWEKEDNTIRWALDEELLDFYGTASFQEYLEENAMTVKATDAVYMVAAAPDNLYKILREVGNIVDTYSWHLIFASDEADFERLWQEMKQKAYDSGMEQVEKYYRVAWADALMQAGKYNLK